jgi:hypothetical protein
MKGTTALRYLSLGLGALALLLPFSVAAQETAVRLEDDSAAGRFVITIGPMDLPAAGHGEHHGEHGAVFPPVETVVLPRDAYLYGFSFEIVDSRGRPVPSQVLHHLNLINPDNRELFLPISQRMLAIGQETGAHSMPWLLFGYPVSAGQRVVVSAMMHNPTHNSYSGAELRLYINYVKRGRPWPLFSVYPFQLDVAFPAGDKSFDLPPGRISRSYEASPIMKGRLLIVGGHLHPYAESLKLEDVTANTVIWEGKPIAGKGGTLEGVTVGRLYRRLGYTIYPDHVYRVTVTYHNPTSDTIPDGGMGVVGGVFLPSGDDPWPRADESDPLYVLDRMHYLRQLRGKYADLVAQLGGKLPEGGKGPEASGGHSHRH